MRIDPKYFNVFLLIVAVIAASLIAFFTISNRITEKQDFKERMLSQDSLKTVYWRQIQGSDSLRISDFKGKFVVTHFWNNWSENRSKPQLVRLKEMFPDSLEIIAAAVGLQREEAQKYIEDHGFPFHFVAGLQQFSEFRVPGLPAQLIYNPEGELIEVYLGYQGDTHLDSLRALINNEKNK